MRTWVIAILAGSASLIFLTTWIVMKRRPSFEVRPAGPSVPDSSASAGARAGGDDWLENYRLTDQSGRPFDSTTLNGKVHVVSFFFASCPGPCFKQNTKLREICAELAPHGVTFVSITCDPETDTPSALNSYARKLEAPADGWHFLTGTLDYIRRVAAEVYSVPLDKGTHVESFLVIDKWGVRRGKFHWNSVEEIKAMRKMLPELESETSAPPPPKPQTSAADGDEAETREESSDEGMANPGDNGEGEGEGEGSRVAPDCR